MVTNLLTVDDGKTLTEAVDSCEAAVAVLAAAQQAVETWAARARPALLRHLTDTIGLSPHDAERTVAVVIRDMRTAAHGLTAGRNGLEGLSDTLSATLVHINTRDPHANRSVTNVPLT